MALDQNSIQISASVRPRGVQTVDQHTISLSQLQLLRLEDDAVKLLEGVFGRMRWQARDRDLIAQDLRDIVLREVRIDREPRHG